MLTILDCKMSSVAAKTTEAYISFIKRLTDCLKRRGSRRQLYIRDLQLHVEHTIQEFLDERIRKELWNAEQLANTIRGTDTKISILTRMNLQFTGMIDKLTKENKKLEKEVEHLKNLPLENAKLRETQQSTQK